MNMTHKEFKQKRAEELDRKFKERYPDGQFTIQRWTTHLGNAYSCIHWNPRRRTSRGPHDGVSVNILNGKIQVKTHQPSSYGKCTYYDSLAKTMAAAARFGLPTELMSAFAKAYGAEIKRRASHD